MLKSIFNKFKLSFKNYYLFLYLFGSICLYFTSELIKSSYLIKRNKYNYDNCINYFTNKLNEDELVNVCEYLNYQENYKTFINNLVYNVILIYILIREVIKDTYFNIKYWLVANLSLIIYTLIGEIDIFKFSIDSNTEYNHSKRIILGSLGIFLFGLLTRQIYKNKIKYSILSKIILFYLFIFMLYRSVTNNIKYHLHHCIFTGILSYFFTNFKSWIDYYFHAILIGIFVQGINFFTINEIFLFNTSHINYPSFAYMSYLQIIFCLLYLIILYILKKLNKNESNDNDYHLYDDLEMQLIPIIN